MCWCSVGVRSGVALSLCQWLGTALAAVLDDVMAHLQPLNDVMAHLQPLDDVMAHLQTSRHFSHGHAIIQPRQARPRSRMLSLRLGSMVIHSQIPMKFIPTLPESNMKMINVKKKIIKKREFHVYYAVFRHVPCLVNKSSFKKSNNFGFLFIVLRHAVLRRPNKL